MKKSFLCSVALLAAVPAFANDQIIKPYQSIRSSGMGGVKITTGLYDQNFFGNPARATANPKFKLTVLDVMAEVNSHSISNLSTLTNDDNNFYSGLAGTSGDNNHLRVQTTIPSVYFPTGENSKMAFAFGILLSSQVDVNLRRSYNVDPAGVMDVGPAFTVARKFLENDALSVGITPHATYRISSNRAFTVLDIIRGKSPTSNAYRAQGSHIDVDLGATYDMPFDFEEFKFTAGLSINNILGGKYTNLGVRPVSDIAGQTFAQPRAFNFGMSAKREQVGPFRDFVLALEIQDVGNNPDGGFFRTFHLGAEGHFGVLMPRVGINQGYLCLGLGLDLPVFNFELATYGEEMSLNPGGLGDRRYAVRIGLNI